MKGKLNFDEFATLKEHVVDPDAVDPQASMRLLVKHQHDTDVRVARMEQQLGRIENMLATLVSKG